jgi:hypothetical protein
MKLDMPSDQFGALVGAAILQTVTQENRDVLIQEAVTHLLTTDKSYSYGGRQRSPLQNAFDYAVEQKAKEVIGQTLDGVLSEKVKEVVEEALVKAFAEERKDKLVQNIADAIIKGFSVERY